MSTLFPITVTFEDILDANGSELRTLIDSALEDMICDMTNTCKSPIADRKIKIELQLNLCSDNSIVLNKKITPVPAPYDRIKKTTEEEDKVAPGQMTLLDGPNVVNADNADDDQDSII